MIKKDIINWNLVLGIFYVYIDENKNLMAKKIVQCILS